MFKLIRKDGTLVRVMSTFVSSKQRTSSGGSGTCFCVLSS
jgi:hypothetical protein